MGLPLKKTDEFFTYGDYLTWPDEERWEIIDGIPYDMSPAPHPFHQYIVAKLTSKIEQFLNGKKCQVYPAPFDVRFPEHNQNDDETLTVVQPDISVICDLSRLDNRGYKGAPDLVIEILSPATSKKDRMTKYYLYERFGVKEYWLVSPEDKTIQVYILQENGKYGRHEVYSVEQILPCFTLPGLNINLAEVFG